MRQSPGESIEAGKYLECWEQAVRRLGLAWWAW